MLMWSTKSFTRVCSFAACLCFISPASAAWKTGDSLPELSGFQLEGKVPSDLKGKVVLLDFWASWCAPCKASFPAMNDLQKKYADQGLVIIGINVDEKSAAMEKFLKGTPASFTTVRDAGHKLVSAADVATMPTSFLVDRSGKIRQVHTGYNGNSTKQQYQKEIEELLKEK
jgi:thiol-disulfide isomerase/thioredoxin